MQLVRAHGEHPRRWRALTTIAHYCVASILCRRQQATPTNPCRFSPILSERADALAQRWADARTVTEAAASGDAERRLLIVEVVAKIPRRDRLTLLGGGLGNRLFRSVANGRSVACRPAAAYQGFDGSRPGSRSQSLASPLDTWSDPESATDEQRRLGEEHGRVRADSEDPEEWTQAGIRAREPNLPPGRPPSRAVTTEASELTAASKRNPLRDGVVRSVALDRTRLGRKVGSRRALRWRRSVRGRRTSPPKPRDHRARAPRSRRRWLLRRCLDDRLCFRRGDGSIIGKDEFLAGLSDSRNVSETLTTTIRQVQVLGDQAV